MDGAEHVIDAPANAFPRADAANGRFYFLAVIDVDPAATGTIAGTWSAGNYEEWRVTRAADGSITFAVTDTVATYSISSPAMGTGKQFILAQHQAGSELTIHVNATKRAQQDAPYPGELLSDIVQAGYRLFAEGAAGASPVNPLAGHLLVAAHGYARLGEVGGNQERSHARELYRHCRRFGVAD
jgi:hypothetical protein